ncbi:senecionine N-oxygenase-like isoform X2 [Leguminivora glycinivorella]|uniref:senecionine N-oxygenase-like isoform X2 n=1 Tax=Leguminivora glycinivorella TaxID=1035111 RepID=UPI00200ECD98|nr:senecionine N-oxygenase-like isoform X2 [Leguminivora glycinivorella]
MSRSMVDVLVLCLVILILDINYGFAKPSHHTCVIGAGYGGLASARYLNQYGVPFSVLEAQRSLGGNWRFQTDLEEDGLPPFTGVYKQLRINVPRQTMEFANWPFPDTTPSFPTGSCFYKYLRNFTKAFDLEKYIQFRSLVTSVKWADTQWEISYMKTDSKEKFKISCDFLIVATGRWSLPNIPRFEGQGEFEGKIIHIQKYKDPEPFRNSRILVIGAGPSGLDMAMHLTNQSARLIHSHHKKYNQPFFGDNYVRKPNVKRFTKNGVVFVDDSFEEVDVVILCTDESCGLTVSRKFVLPVYQHMVNIRRPTMVLLSLPTLIIPKVLDTQANYAASLAAGKFELPSQDDMMASWLQQFGSRKVVDVNLLTDQMDQYFANLSAEAGTPRVPPVITNMRDFNAVNRLEDLLNYRDYNYKVLDDHHFERFYNPREEICDIDS